MVSIKNKILKLLAKEDLMSSEISKKLEIKVDNVWIYLNTLYRESKVERITDKKPYVYRAITPLAYLKRLCELMGEKMEYNKVPNEEDMKLIKHVVELIN